MIKEIHKDLESLPREIKQEIASMIKQATRSTYWERNYRYKGWAKAANIRKSTQDKLGIYLSSDISSDEYREYADQYKKEKKEVELTLQYLGFLDCNDTL